MFDSFTSFPALAEALRATVLDSVWGLAALTVLVAGFVKGMTGFGSALVMMPVISGLFGPAGAVAVLQLVDGPASWTMVPRALKRCERKQVFLLAGGAAVGMPLGIVILKVTDPDILRHAIAVTVLLMAAGLASGWRYRGRPSAALSAGTGATAGLLGGATGIGGPPVVLFWLGSQSEGAAVRANLTVYFATGTLMGLTSLTIAGLITETAILRALTLAPVFALGLVGGSRAFGLLSETAFRRAALALVAGSGVTGLAM